MPPDEQSIKSTPRACELPRQDEAILDRPAIGAVVQILAPVDAGKTEEERGAVRQIRAHAGSRSRARSAYGPAGRRHIDRCVGWRQARGRSGSDSHARRGYRSRRSRPPSPAARSRHSRHQCLDLGDRHRAGTVPTGDAARIESNSRAATAARPSRPPPRQADRVLPMGAAATISGRHGGAALPPRRPARAGNR